MPSTPIATTKMTERRSRLFPVATDSLETRVLPVDLYLEPRRGATPVLFRAVGIQFTAEEQRRLLESGVQYLYVPIHQHAAYRRAMLDRLDRLYHDPQQTQQERVRVVRATCTKAIEDVLLFPDRAEAIAAVGEIGQQFTTWSAQDKGGFSYLLDMSAHDYYTVTHMVNVGVGCGLLGRTLRPHDETLNATLIQGGMLHDIGKRGVPEDILNKVGPLDPEEWQVIRRHPELGFEELRRNPAVSADALDMVRDHHERLDGKGYARGVKEGALGLPARICAVVDVFDAICASRPYRGPTSPLDALDIMREGAGTQFDREALSAWIHIVDEAVAADPGRAVPRSDSPRALLTAFQAYPRGGGDGVAYSELLNRKERRRFPRFSCGAAVRVQFLHQGKAYPVGLREWTDFRLRDISRGGVELRTPWPLTIDDLLEIEIPLSETWKVQRMARVVRVRKGPHQGWRAGVCFITTG